MSGSECGVSAFVRLCGYRSWSGHTLSAYVMLKCEIHAGDITQIRTTQSGLNAIDSVSCWFRSKPAELMATSDGMWPGRRLYYFD